MEERRKNAVVEAVGFAAVPAKGVGLVEDVDNSKLYLPSSLLKNPSQVKASG